MTNKRLLAKLGLIVTTAIWGSTFLLVQESLDGGTTPFTFIFFRFLFAAIIIIPFLSLNANDAEKVGSSLNTFNRNEIFFGFLCGFLLYAGYVFQTYGLIFTLETKSAFITGTSVLIVPIIVFIYKRQKMSYKLIISILVVLLGLYLFQEPGKVTGANINNFAEKSVPNIGDVLTFGCAIFFAMHIVAQSDAVQNKINLMRFLIIQFLTVSILSGLSTLFTEGFIANYDSQLLISLIINGIFASTIAIFIMVWAQKILSASETAIIFSLEPIFALIFSIIINGIRGFESYVGILQWSGGVLIVAAVIYYSIETEN